MSYAIGVVGATGQVGRTFLNILEEGDRPGLPIGSLRLFASQRSAGKRLRVRGEEYVVELAEPNPRLFEGLDFVMTAVGDDQAKVYAPVVAQAGALDVDKSNAWRMDPSVPLVVPEVNPGDARHHRGIIAGPNCSTIQMVVALWPIHQVNPIRRIIVDTYQSVSGAGWKGMDELQRQVEDYAGGREPRTSLYRVPIFHNLIPEIGSLKSDGLFSEEQKMLQETRKIFHAPELGVSATCVRVPVPVSHSEAIHIELERPMEPEDAREILRQAPGVEVVDEPERSRYPMPNAVAGCDPVYVGRIRRDLSHPRGLALWVVGDNLRKGAALNAIQVFELVARHGWLTRQEVQLDAV